MRRDRVLYNVMVRRFALALGIAVAPLAAAAAPTPEPPAAAGDARNGGTIDGRLTAVDFQRSVIGVDAGPHGRFEVDVMPSTSIEGKDSAYHAFTDLKAGQRVEIFSSISGGKYVAQIIRILP
jgi:hypothetical protein